MFAHFRRFCASVLLAALAAGCCSCGFPCWGDQALSLDSSKIGTGQQTITPRSDAEFVNGEPVNQRAIK